MIDLFETTILEKEKIKMKNPILIEGLPGIGLVGKIAADHMIAELRATKVADIISPHFPHQVIMQKNGVMRMIKNRLFHVKGKKNDLLILVGDVQAVTSEAQYEVTGKMLDYAQKKGVKFIITLGGYGTGRVHPTPRIFGIVSHKHLVEQYKKFGIIFGESKGSIIGAAGLLLGLGKTRGMEGLCIMGETHGGFVDPKSAQGVLESLSKILEIKVDTKKLDSRAKESEAFAKKMEKEAMAAKGMGMEPGKHDLSYIR
ncbi:TPA: proteasome assembly chaperone family protein [Candidatus Micrarchaeota archaeon]|nr:proteasome assembly chaperone family protein [Candidatus Micrarchaeota archaeon]HIH30062.1 proteasome assembly chaperone family protein [Candidatus Micrarchaeota archaeon]